jgi:hypothetical protein
LAGAVFLGAEKPSGERPEAAGRARCCLKLSCHAEPHSWHELRCHGVSSYWLSVQYHPRERGGCRVAERSARSETDRWLQPTMLRAPWLAMTCTRARGEWPREVRGRRAPHKIEARCYPRTPGSGKAGKFEQPVLRLRCSTHRKTRTQHHGTPPPLKTLPERPPNKNTKKHRNHCDFEWNP